MAEKDKTERTDPALMVPTHRQNLVDRVEDEGLDIDVKDPTGGTQLGPDEASFINPALVGSGTIMPDGTYGAPLPDPNLARVNEETSTDLQFATPEDEREAKDAGTTGGAKTSVVEPKAATKSTPAKKANQ
jgi:hypothetical protein